MLAGCSDDNGGSAIITGLGGDAALSTDAALAAIRDLTTRVSPGPGESIEVDACPMGDIEALAAVGPAEVIEVAVGVPTTYQYVFQSELAGEHPFVTCMLESPDGVSNVGLSVGVVVPDFKEDTSRVLSEFTLTFEPDATHLGGTMLRYCAAPLGDGQPFCEADWFDGNVWVGVFITADARSVAAAEQWLRAVLPGVLDATVASSPTVQAI